MAAQVEPEQGLARAFAEYSLLPDLLVRTVPGEGAPASWTQLLGDIGFTVDHIDDDELPPVLGVTAIMAEDAWRISQWLDSSTRMASRDAGRQIAEVARTSMKDRSEAVWGPADAVLAQQVRECYRAVTVCASPTWYATEPEPSSRQKIIGRAFVPDCCWWSLSPSCTSPKRTPQERGR